MLGKPIYKLRDWIPAKKLDFRELLINPHPHALFLLEKQWHEIRANHRDLSSLLCNEGAAQMIEAHWDEIMQEISAPDCVNCRCCTCWQDLSHNPTTVHLLDKYWDKNALFMKLNWLGLGGNPNAFSLLQKHWECAFLPEKIEWIELALNPSPDAVRLFEKHWDAMMQTKPGILRFLCANPNAVSLIQKHQDEMETNDLMDWRLLCKNTNPAAIPLLEKQVFPQVWNPNEDWDAWCNLMANPNALHLVERHWNVFCDHMDEDSWNHLYGNPNIVSFLEKHWDKMQSKINWNALCCNSSVAATLFVEKHWDSICNDRRICWKKMIEIGLDGYFYELSFPFAWVETHWDKVKKNKAAINWRRLSCKPGIFVLDYAAMRDQARPFAEELAAKVFHPRRVAAWEAAGIDVAEDL